MHLKFITTKLRKFPYPYLAGLSIASDCDLMSIDVLELLIEFFNTDNKTIIGQGLSLPVSFSFFFYTDDPNEVSYFIGEKEFCLSPNANKLVHFIKNGYIDTLHSYGNFDRLSFKREYAKTALEELKKHGITLLVYTNHGNSNNIQNIGGEADYHQGDLVSSFAYHVDLTLSYGIRFLWPDGYIIDDINFNLCDRIKSLIRSKREGSINKTLIVESKLQDGNKIIKFYRYRGTGRHAPNISSLQAQLNRGFLETIINKRAAIVLYQHLGVLYKTNTCVPLTVHYMKNNKNLFNPFKLLARYYQDGLIWVEKLATFLNFFYWRELIEIKEINTENRIILEIVPKKMPEVVRSFQEEFQYQTIYIDYNKPVSVICFGEELPIRYNGPDETGRPSVTIEPVTKEAVWR